MIWKAAKENKILQKMKNDIRLYYIKFAVACCLILFFFIPLQFFGQSDRFSDFEKRKNKAVSELKKFTSPDTARVNALVRIFKNASFLKEDVEVKPYCDEALAISRKLNYSEGLAKCYCFMGGFFKSSSDPLKAQIYFDSVIQLSNNVNDTTLFKQKAFAQRFKGMIYYDQENYYEALNYLFEALKYYEYHSDIVTFSTYKTIGNIYIALNNFEQAGFYAKKNIELAEKKFSTQEQIQAYLSLIDIAVPKGQLHLAMYYLDKIKPYIPDSVQMMYNYGYYQNRGRVSYLLQQYDSSFLYYQQAYKYAEFSKHNFNINNALYYLSLTALKLGKKDIAKKYAEENLVLAEKANSREAKINALLNLSDYYHATGNQGNAFDLLQQATQLKDSLLSETNVKQMNTLAAVYENDKKQKEILQLQSEKQIQETTVNKKSTLNMIFIAIIIGLLFFGYLAYLNFRSRQKIGQQQQKIQQQQISELEKDRQLLIVDAMLKGQEDERSRIAKDLHDGLGGMLSGVKLSFINIKQKAALSAEYINGFEQSVKLLDNTIGELRKVAHNLMPEVLIRFGLDEALKEYCSSIQTSSNIAVIYQRFGKERKLSRQAEINIYRIVQELVNNALKHAGAKQIIVQLTKSPGKTSITVEDDGKGFDVKTSRQKKGAGMSNIEYRVNYFKGSFDIVSEPDNGTSVNIELMA
jgi:two-component system, NarL family, sensor kinase